MLLGRHSRTLAQANPDLLRLVADGLYVVPVRVKDVAAVVVGVVDRSRARCAVVGPACLDGCGVEGVHLRPVVGPQRDVKPTPHRLSRNEPFAPKGATDPLAA
jgi:hypothetical protein